MTIKVCSLGMFQDELGISGTNGDIYICVVGHGSVSVSLEEENTIVSNNRFNLAMEIRYRKFF